MSRMSDFIICVVEQYADKKTTDEIVEYIWNTYNARVSKNYIEQMIVEYKNILEG